MDKKCFKHFCHILPLIWQYCLGFTIVCTSLKIRKSIDLDATVKPPISIATEAIINLGKKSHLGIGAEYSLQKKTAQAILACKKQFTPSVSAGVIVNFLRV